MRTLALALAASLAVTAAEAACLPNDLGCYVHGGSGMTLGEGGFVPRDNRMNRMGSDFYADQPTQRATSPRQRLERTRRATPEPGWRDESPWSTQSDWGDLQGSESEQGVPWAGTTAAPGEMPAQRGPVNAPQAPVNTTQMPARAPQAVSNMPQLPANSVDNRLNTGNRP